MASALASNPGDALLRALDDLEEDNFKRLKFYLRNMTLAEGQPLLARGELEGLSRVDLASILTSKCGEQEALRVVLKGLKAMNLMELVDQFSHICLNGECSGEKGSHVVSELPPRIRPQIPIVCNLFLLSPCPPFLGVPSAPGSHVVSSRGS